MPWIEIELSPQSEWNENGLEDWALALGALLPEKETGFNPQICMSPGYNVVQLGEEGTGKLTLNSAERLVILDGLSSQKELEYDFARFLVDFARQMGALGIMVSISNSKEKSFWTKFGGVVHPEPVPLEGTISRGKVAVEQLSEFSLLVTYRGESVLCLEPIRCNAHAPGVVSLAQRRLEKMFGGKPLGFASRVTAHCPWTISREQWGDLLAYSRLQAFDLLEDLVTSR